jgi:SAM-dependent methyltransferase
MKMRDSGMPDESYWETLFDIPLVLNRMEMSRCRDVAELGCGYGTFTEQIAKSICGTIYTFDVDPEMISRTKERTHGLSVVCEQRDVMENGFGVKADCVLLFNILHCERPVELLRHAAAAINPGGQVKVIHWLYGQTPRGPSLAIRPRPEQIVEWAWDAGLEPIEGVIDLPPWHYGIRFRISQQWN